MWACWTESWRPGLWFQVGHSVGCRPWIRRTSRPSHRAQKNSPTPPTERRTIRTYVGWSDSFLFRHSASVVCSPPQRGRKTPRWNMYSCSRQACPVLLCFTPKDELHSSSFFSFLFSLFSFFLSFFFFFLPSFLSFLLEYNCFTMFCYFLLYNEVNQLYVYLYPLLLGPPSHPSSHPTHLGRHRALSWASCAL